MNEIVGDVAPLGWVALKALLLFLTAVAGLRLARRRTIAEMGAFDFVAAVAVGAIVGRVPNSTTTTYLEGAVTLVTILAVHAALSHLRYDKKAIAGLIDHPPSVLVLHGEVDERQMRRSGLTRDDLFALLRARGVPSLAQVRYAIFEQRGAISVVTEHGWREEDEDEVFSIVHATEHSTDSGRPDATRRTPNR